MEQGILPRSGRFYEMASRRNLHITLNIHPADGIRAFEEMYPEMAQAMGIDPDTEQPVVFDISNPDFLDACFGTSSTLPKKKA